MKSEHKYQKEQTNRLFEINQEDSYVEFVESKLKGISKSDKCCTFIRQMMHQVWFETSNSYNLIWNHIESKINKLKISKGNIEKYLPGLIKVMYNCDIKFISDNLKTLLSCVNLKWKYLKLFVITRILLRKLFEVNLKKNVDSF